MVLLAISEKGLTLENRARPWKTPYISFFTNGKPESAAENCVHWITAFQNNWHHFRMGTPEDDSAFKFGGLNITDSKERIIDNDFNFYMMAVDGKVVALNIYKTPNAVTYDYSQIMLDGDDEPILAFSKMIEEAMGKALLPWISF